MQQNCELLVGHGLQYIRIIWIGLSTRLVNHYTVYITEPITVRKEMIGKRDTYWGISETRVGAEATSGGRLFQRQLQAVFCQSAEGSVIIRRTSYCNFDELLALKCSFTCAGDIISRLHELQSLTVDETKDKDKQKSDAKSIVHRRRKALVDLFKALEWIGTSS